MPVTFCPLASGSNGNSLYIGTEKTHILIDAGMSGKNIEEGLSSVSVTRDGKREAVTGGMLSAIFVTHEHSDHIQGAGVMSRRYNIPIYATEKTWLSMLRHNMLGNVAEKNRRIVSQGAQTAVGDLDICPFSIPHDSTDPVGYTVTAGHFKLSLATDIGHPTDTVKQNIADSDILLLESNHDLEMLENGRYPRRLKDRVSGDRGHLSNVSAGRLLTEMVTTRLKHVFLGHLSEENNRPLLALDTVTRILEANHIQAGRDFQLYLANRGVASQMLVLSE